MIVPSYRPLYMMRATKVLSQRNIRRVPLVNYQRLRILTWFEKVWMCEGAGLSQVPVWNLPLLGRLDG